MLMAPAPEPAAATANNDHEVLWHAELAVECLLFAFLWYRRCPFWFGILVGIDCVAQLSQIILYRAEYHEFARLFSRAGYIAVAALSCLALVEATNLDPGRLKFWHVRILAFWVAVEELCAAMQVGQPDPVLFWWNHVLLIGQLAVFAVWIWLFWHSE